MLNRFDPFAEMSRLQDEIRRFGLGDSRGYAFVPVVDIYEDKEGIHVKAELPGLKTDDVQIHVENNVLTLSGERKFERDEKKEGYHRIERSYGRFSRSFALPNVVDADKIVAQLKDGVLTVVVPKKQEAQPRKIAVTATE